MVWIVAVLVVAVVIGVLIGRQLILARQRRAQLGPLAERLRAETLVPGSLNQKGLN